MKLIFRDTNSLIPYANNSRTHAAEQIARVAASIKEFGFTNPVLIDKNNGIIAGHCRVEAAKLLQQKQVPTIALENLSNAQIRAYVLADNKLALDAGWNEELLKIELLDLKNLDYDLNLTGFTDEEIELLLPSVAPLLEDAPAAKESRFTVFVECSDQHEQQKLFDELENRGFNCKIVK